MIKMTSCRSCALLLLLLSIQHCHARFALSILFGNNQLPNHRISVHIPTPFLSTVDDIRFKKIVSNQCNERTEFAERWKLCSHFYNSQIDGWDMQIYDPYTIVFEGIAKYDPDLSIFRNEMFRILTGIDTTNVTVIIDNVDVNVQKISQGYDFNWPASPEVKNMSLKISVRNTNTQLPYLELLSNVGSRWEFVDVKYQDHFQEPENFTITHASHPDMSNVSVAYIRSAIKLRPPLSEELSPDIICFWPGLSCYFGKDGEVALGILAPRTLPDKSIYVSPKALFLLEPEEMSVSVLEQFAENLISFNVQIDQNRFKGENENFNNFPAMPNARNVEISNFFTDETQSLVLQDLFPQATTMILDLSSFILSTTSGICALPSSLEILSMENSASSLLSCDLTDYENLTSITLTGFTFSDWNDNSFPSNLEFLNIDTAKWSSEDDEINLSYLSTLKELQLAEVSFEASSFILSESLLSVIFSKSYFRSLPVFTEKLNSLTYYSISWENRDRNFFDTIPLGSSKVELRDCGIFQKIPRELPPIDALTLHENGFVADGFNIFEEYISTNEEMQQAVIFADWINEISSKDIDEGAIQGYYLNSGIAHQEFWSCDQFAPDECSPINMKSPELRILGISPGEIYAFVYDIKIEASLYAVCTNNDSFTPLNVSISYREDFDEWSPFVEFILNESFPLEELTSVTIDLNDFVTEIKVASLLRVDGIKVGFSVCEDEASTNIKLQLRSDCPIGQYAILRDSTDAFCTTCDAGRYSNTSSATTCSFCDVGKYQDQISSTSCISCNENFTTSGIGSQSKSMCICHEGTFGNYHTDCTICPEGAVCEEGSDFPFVARGYFFIPETASVYVCAPRRACLSTHNGRTMCAPGYSGHLCSDCAEGYHKFGTECQQCSGSPGIALFFAIVGVLIVVLFALRKGIPSFTKAQSFRILFSWIQIIALFSSLPVHWPGRLRSFYGSASVTNLDVDYVAPECLISMDRYWDKWLMRIWTPLILIGCVLLTYIFQETYWRTRGQHCRIFSYSLKDCCKKYRSPDLEENDKFFRTRYIYGTIQLLTLCYTMLCSTVFEPLNCLSQFDGRYTMFYDPQIYCYEDYWKNNILPYVILFSLLWVFGIPLFLAIFLYYHRRDLYSVRILSKVGSLLIPYRETVPWYDIFVMLRKAVIVIAIEAFTSEYGQIYFMIGLLCICVLIEVVLKPYRTKSNNLLSLIWMLVTMLCLFTGTVFNNSDISTESKDLFAGIVVTMMIFSILFSIVAIYQEQKSHFIISRRQKQDHVTYAQFQSEFKQLIMEQYPVTGRRVYQMLSTSDYQTQNDFYDELVGKTPEGPQPLALL